MLERGTPSGVCDLAWRGDVRRQVNCSFSNLLAAGTAPSVAVQQQLLQPRPPLLPSSLPPPLPTLRYQPPQYQAATAVGGGAAGGEAGASRPPRVAHFSRNYGPGGLGGASAERRAGRGGGSN